MGLSSSGLRSLQEFVRKLPLFADLSLADVEQVCRSAKRLEVPAGEVVIEEGASGDSVYVVLSGELEITKRDGERQVVLARRRTGESVGEMSLLERTPRTASVRALRDSELLEISPESFRTMLEASPAMATTVLRTIAGRLRSTEAQLMQSDKLAALGTLAAGLAHELNNPAAAIQRSADQLRDAIENWRRLTLELQAQELSATERERLGELETGIAQSTVQNPGDAASVREEDRVTALLEQLGVPSPWDLSPALLAYGWGAQRLAAVAQEFAVQHRASLLQWLGAGLLAQQLTSEIRRSAQAISEIVRAVKSYAYLDQAPVQDVDLRTSLEDTLTILRHKLKAGIEVRREFESGLPRIEAYAGELNQVWTNLIDNAIQAMGGHGVLVLGARVLGDEVEVHISDNGPGVPAEIQPRIFEPFFTTKPQGVGTGLGLHIAYSIVVERHHGHIDFDSEPGRTEFRVRLPLRMRRETVQP